MWSLKTAQDNYKFLLLAIFLLLSTPAFSQLSLGQAEKIDEDWVLVWSDEFDYVRVYQK
jgi:hypothetical protein